MRNLEKIDINGSQQWILVKGQAKAPLILHIQAGPGLPMISEADMMEKLLGLEKDFLVAYWDQRACGKSFDACEDPQNLTFEQLRDDVLACMQYLMQKYQQPNIIVIAYSIGASLALMAAAQKSSWFRHLFLVGMDIDLPKANVDMLDWALSKAKELGNRKWLRTIDDLKSKGVADAKAFQKRAKLMTNLGGIKTNTSYNQLLWATIRNMLFNKAYGWSDIPKTIKGMDFCQKVLLPELNALNLFDLVEFVDVPLHFVQGRKDGVAPYNTALAYFDFLKAAKKTFSTFEHSAHMPHIEEPAKFAGLVRGLDFGEESKDTRHKTQDTRHKT